MATLSDDRSRTCLASELKKSFRRFVASAESLRQKKKLIFGLEFGAQNCNLAKASQSTKAQVTFQLVKAELDLFSASIKRANQRGQIFSHEAESSRCFKLFYNKRKAFLQSTKVKEALKAKWLVLAIKLKKKKLP